MYWSRGSVSDLFGVPHRNMIYNTARPGMSRILIVLTPHQRLAAEALLAEGVVIVCLVLVCVLIEVKVVLVVLVMQLVLVCVFKEAQLELVTVVGCVGVRVVLDLEFKEVERDAERAEKGLIVFVVLGCVTEAGMEAVVSIECVAGVKDAVHATDVLSVVVKAVHSIEFDFPDAGTAVAVAVGFVTANTDVLILGALMDVMVRDVTELEQEDEGGAVEPRDTGVAVISDRSAPVIFGPVVFSVQELVQGVFLTKDVESLEVPLISLPLAEVVMLGAV